MAEFDFDFCLDRRVAETMPPEEPAIKDFTGWDYAPTPSLPYRRKFKISLEGLRWYFLENGQIDLVTDASHNAGALEAFYTLHRQHKPFNYLHEWMGTMELRFNSPVMVPKAMPNSGGLIEGLELTAIHHNPTYTS